MTPRVPVSFNALLRRMIQAGDLKIGQRYEVRFTVKSPLIESFKGHTSLTPTGLNSVVLRGRNTVARDWYLKKRSGTVEVLSVRIVEGTVLLETGDYLSGDTEHSHFGGEV